VTLLISPRLGDALLGAPRLAPFSSLPCSLRRGSSLLVPNPPSGEFRGVPKAGLPQGGPPLPRGPIWGIRVINPSPLRLRCRPESVGPRGPSPFLWVSLPPATQAFGQATHHGSSGVLQLGFYAAYAPVRYLTVLHGSAPPVWRSGAVKCRQIAYGRVCFFTSLQRQ